MQEEDVQEQKQQQQQQRQEKQHDEKEKQDAVVSLAAKGNMERQWKAKEMQ